MDSTRDLGDVITGLRVVRNYRAEPVSSEDTAAILEAGRWTGSAKNRQDWAVFYFPLRGKYPSGARGMGVRQ